MTRILWAALVLILVMWLVGRIAWRLYALTNTLLIVALIIAMAGLLISRRR